MRPAATMPASGLSRRERPRLMAVRAIKTGRNHCRKLPICRPKTQKMPASRQGAETGEKRKYTHFLVEKPRPNPPCRADGPATADFRSPFSVLRAWTNHSTNGRDQRISQSPNGLAGFYYPGQHGIIREIAGSGTVESLRVFGHGPRTVQLPVKQAVCGDVDQHQAGPGSTWCLRHGGFQATRISRHRRAAARSTAKIHFIKAQQSTATASHENTTGQPAEPAIAPIDKLSFGSDIPVGATGLANRKTPTRDQVFSGAALDAKLMAVTQTSVQRARL